MRKYWENWLAGYSGLAFIKFSSIFFIDFFFIFHPFGFFRFAGGGEGEENTIVESNTNSRCNGFNEYRSALKFEPTLTAKIFV